ncbi:MAG TPA: hypothetical protein VIM14_00260 [Polyangia bacterium]|jgi:NAD(P)H-nitrite reductase large subunit
MLPDAALLCNCHNVSKGTICKAIADDGLTDLFKGELADLVSRHAAQPAKLAAIG